MDNFNQPPAQIQKRKDRKLLVIFIILLIIFAGLSGVLLLMVSNRLGGLENAGSSSLKAGKYEVGKIATSDDPFAGSREAKIVIVEFSDFQCPYCFAFFPVARQVIDTYGNQIKFVYRDFPISSLHPQAEIAAEAGECAHEQGKFWEMHDKIFINRSDLSRVALKEYAAEVGLNTQRFNECLDSRKYKDEVQADYNDGIRAGVDGTPTLFINDKKFEGAMTFENLRAVIDGLVSIYHGS